ncbi:MAG: hypothetical protein U0359_25460 [Byssovorax sp.]
MARSGQTPASEEQPVVLGVRLDQYAGVTAALAEGLVLKDILAQEDLAEATWPEADRAWKEELADAPDLLLRYQRLRRSAEDCLARPAPPVDDDPAAWAGLLGALAASDDPDLLLRGFGLRMVDIGRLGRSWQRRAADDPKVADRLIKLAGKAQPPREVRSSAPVLRPFPWTPAPRPVESAPQNAPPPVVSERAPILPSAYIAARPLPAHEDLAPPPIAPRALADIAPPAFLAQRPLSETIGAPLPPGAHGSPVKPALPFGEEHSSAFLQEVASGPRSAEMAQSGETIGLPTGPKIKAPALPFQGAQVERLPAPASATALGETIGLGEKVSAQPAMPFDVSGKPEEPYGLTLAQYASLWAELAMYPDRVRAVLRRYGLPDEDARKKLNEAWGKRFLKEPALRRAWMDLCAQYRDWLKQQGGAAG